MTKLEEICITFSLTLLLCLSVGGALNTDQKWAGGNHFGYQGGFCFPGLCVGGTGGSRVNFGTGGGGYRQTMYCKPLTCYGGSCDALHLHLDKGLYESLVSNNAAKHPSTVGYNIPETFKDSVNRNYEFKEVKDAAMAPQSSN
ncbi:hypothetical protein CARUB_v10022044mg [Capsella rubella]|uniref:MF21 n=1 Tax=Capsella rubella TaxID=81985 RepID=R0ICY8_9BRAS|nr:uncharacterized protein LOC17895140 [Capsella rubella]EOA34503.1 hypothetical protein CARUB_v10022044mg [Capsella rubella]